MGITALLRLDGKDIFGFAISNLLALMLTLFLPQGAWSVYVSILVSYHLFLAWLVLFADHEAGFSLPVVQTIMTHAACIALVVTIGLGRHHIPYFGVLRYGIISIAVFERGWLLGGEKKKEPKPEAIAEAATHHATVANSNADDYQEWLNYLATRPAIANRPGSSFKAEYAKWLANRAQSRAETPSNNTPP